MMLPTCGGSSTEVTALSVQPSSPCKLQTLYPPLSPSLFPGFNSPRATRNLHKSAKNRHARLSEDVRFQGFKLHCHSKVVTLPDKKVTFNGKMKSKYGGILPSILRSIECDEDFEKTLDSYIGKLSPKEQTVMLKEQSRWDKVLRVFEWFKSQEDYAPNVIHYNIVLRAVGRAKKWDELRLCWIEMARKGVLPTNNTYGMLVDVYGKAGLMKEALLWIKHMKSRGIFPDEVTMSTVIKVLKDAGDYDRADRFYKAWCVGKIELGDLDLDSIGDHETISFKQFLLSELLRTGRRSYSLTNEIDDCVRKPRLTATYNTLIDLYGKAGRLKEAADVFSDMLKSGVALDTFTFNTMIFICGSQGQLCEAQALLNKMDERGISPDTKTYNIFLSLYANVGNMDAALESYRRIREVGLSPDGVTYRAVLKILSERNMVCDVEGVIQEMEKMGKHIDESSLPLLTKMYVCSGFCEQAKALVEKYKSYGFGFSTKAHAAIMDVYAENGLWAEAEALFSSSKFEHKDVLEYNVMIKAYGKAGLYEKAVLLFRGMKTQGTWPDECTYNSFIQMLAGGDLVDSARTFLAEMQEARFQPSCSTFSAVIACLARNKMLTDAIDVFEEMCRVDVQPNEVVYGSLIDAFAEDGNFDEANRYFLAMEQLAISANHIILTSMIKAYAKIGSVEGAKLVYERMKSPDIVASNTMLHLYGDLGMLSEAKTMYAHLVENSSADGVTYATMIYAYKNLGMLDRAMEVAREMKHSGLLVDCVTYSKVMACYAINGELLECGELLHEMVADKKLSPDGGIFKVLFTILKKGGMPDEAVKQLQSSYAQGKPFAKRAVITSVYSIVGLHAYALELCAKGELGFDSFAYNAVIRAYTAYGKIDQALNMFMRMQDEGLQPDIVTLISLVHCYGKAGMVEGIKRVHSQLKYGAVEPNESLYKAVVDAYRNANRHDLAELAGQDVKLVSGETFMDQ